MLSFMKHIFKKMQAFKAIYKNLDLKSQVLLHDIKTCWNSTCHMLSVSFLPNR